MHAILIAVILTAVMVFCAAAENWPGWRGPRGTGVSAEERLPLKWGPQKNVFWRLALPSAGNSSPVVWKDRVFLAQTTAGIHTIMCLNRTSGALLWQCGVADVAYGKIQQPPGDCSATPVTDGERIIALFGTSLCCFDLKGEELWIRELDHLNPIRGNASSPILHGDLCVVSLDAPGRLVALDKRTGKIIWQVNPSVTDEIPASLKPDDAAGRSTPLVIQAAGREELVLSSPFRISAFRPDTGGFLWSCKGLGEKVYASALWEEELVAMSSFGNARAIAVKPGGSGDVTQTRRQLYLEQIRSCTGSGIVHNGHLYIIGDDGVAECINIKTGKAMWTKSLQKPVAQSRSWPSMLHAGELLYVPNTAGDVFVLRASPAFEALATNSVHEPMGASLAASDGEIFMRTDRSLWRIGNGK